MYLSEAAKFLSGEYALIKEGQFDTLGVLGDIDCSRGLLTYVESEKYIDAVITNPNIKCVICKNALTDYFNKTSIGVCAVESPKRIFFEIHNNLLDSHDFYERTVRSISKSSKIHKSANIADAVVIGDHTVIEPNVTIYDNVEIGSNVIIRSGSVIGGEGFKFLRDGEIIIGVKHAGKVRIFNNVEIHSNCCIDKAIFEGATEIGEYTKFDNFVHIAHNVKVGKRCMIAANATVAGYTMIGDDTWIGPSATISNSVKIGDNARITIGTVVTKDVGSGEAVYLPRQQINIPQELGNKL